MLNGTDCNPFCNDFTHPGNSPVTQTHQVLSKLREIEKASSESEFNGKFNRPLNQKVRDMESVQFFLGEMRTFINEKEELKRI